MSDHILEKLGAYMDGELNNRDHQKVQQHLDECLSCQDEYDSLRSLSTLLQEAPLPDFPSAKHFAADVALRLPRKEDVSMDSKVLEFGWWMAPVGLIVVWLFISTAVLVSNMATTASSFGLLDSTSAWFDIASNSTNYSAFLGRFGLLEPSNLERLTTVESFTRTFISSIFWQVAIAMLYLSWIAIWWARQTFRGLGQPLES